MTDASAKLTLPEYENNAFIRSLPPLRSQREIYGDLLDEPSFNRAERSLPAFLRKHCVLRLNRHYRPMARQVQLADRIGMAIRQGYIGRNPGTGDYLKHLHAGVERIEAESLEAQTTIKTHPTGCSLALIGCSGSGKSQTVQRTLASYPQLIQHNEPFSLIQIVWLKLDSPTQGSPKQLCINFFAAVDALLKTDYSKRYGSLKNSVEIMILHMAQVASLHALGLLVVDEIQNLARTAIGPEALLNFLVLLINTVGIPVFVIGTLSALPIVQRNFRQARRSTGLASAIWDRVPRGKEWDEFVTFLWTFQWTRDQTELTTEIREVLYDESQGIVDVLVKLFTLAQLRLISIAETRKNASEVITPQLLRAVSQDTFQIIRPMIEALRKNNVKALAKYDDLMPLQIYVDEVVSLALGKVDTESLSVDESSAQCNVDVDAANDVASEVTRSLIANGVAADVAAALVSEIAVRLPSADPLDFLAEAIQQLRGSPPKKAKPKGTKKVGPNQAPLDDHDMRRIVAEGKAVGKSPYSALHEAGLVGPPPSLQAA